MPAPKSASNPLQALTRKAGPLPVWAWAAILGLLFYLYSHRTSSVAAPASSSSPAITPAQASASTPPDLSSQLSSLGASLSDIAAGQSVLQGYDETLLQGQQAIWDSYYNPNYAPVGNHMYVGGNVNGSATSVAFNPTPGVYDFSGNPALAAAGISAQTPLVLPGGNVQTASGTYKAKLA